MRYIEVQHNVTSVRLSFVTVMFVFLIISRADTKFQAWGEIESWTAQSCSTQTDLLIISVSVP